MHQFDAANNYRDDDISNKQCVTRDLLHFESDETVYRKEIY